MHKYLSSNLSSMFAIAFHHKRPIIEEHSMAYMSVELV